VLNNVMLTVAQGRRDRGSRAGDCWYLVTDEGGAVHGAAMRTPPNGMVLAGAAKGVAEALAEAQDGPIPHASGTVRYQSVERLRYQRPPPAAAHATRTASTIHTTGDIPSSLLVGSVATVAGVVAGVAAAGVEDVLVDAEGVAFVVPGTALVKSKDPSIG
jgi:hypothetical protein